MKWLKCYESSLGPKGKGCRTKVANYIRREFGAKRKTRFLQDEREMTQKLKLSPSIGQIDPLFSDRGRTYRSVKCCD